MTVEQTKCEFFSTILLPLGAIGVREKLYYGHLPPLGLHYSATMVRKSLLLWSLSVVADEIHREGGWYFSI